MDITVQSLLEEEEVASAEEVEKETGKETPEVEDESVDLDEDFSFSFSEEADSKDDESSEEDKDDKDDKEEDLEEEMSLRGMAEVFRVLDENATEEQLHEAMNIIRMNKQSKTTNLAHRTALVMSRQANDPLYIKYAKFNGLRLQIRATIFKKYGAKAASRARQMMSGTAKPLTRK